MLVLGPFRLEVDLVKQDFASFDQLLVGQFEVFVFRWHIKVRFDQVLQVVVEHVINLTVDAVLVRFRLLITILERCRRVFYKYLLAPLIWKVSSLHFFYRFFCVFQRISLLFVFECGEPSLLSLLLFD